MVTKTYLEEKSDLYDMYYDPRYPALRGQRDSFRDPWQNDDSTKS